jgi:hypothetical protein
MIKLIIVAVIALPILITVLGALLCKSAMNAAVRLYDNI